MLLSGSAFLGTVQVARGQARPQHAGRVASAAPPCCSYDQDVYERQRSTPSSAPLIRSPGPPPPPPPPPKAGGGNRRNLLAAFVAIAGVSAGYQLSQGGRQPDTASVGSNGARQRRWTYVDAKGSYDEATALRDLRRPILRVAGDTVEVLKTSDDNFLRMHVSGRDAHHVIMEGKMGEFYTLRASDKVDMRDLKSLLQYFSNPRWEMGMSRSAIQGDS
ncbi:hypothetical protein WJX73_002735 [Symbiochloris irregularis]|uniref:Uncharacterized protein n=1 Tax=Symbiochloris irregularis TaxID=706552 RepID=A0AAW1PZK9_9CHLO